MLTSMDGTSLTPLDAVTSINTKTATQAIDLLREVFGITDSVEIATILKDAGYAPKSNNEPIKEPILKALKATMNLSAAEAHRVLIEVFEVNPEAKGDIDLY